MVEFMDENVTRRLGRPLHLSCLALGSSLTGTLLDGWTLGNAIQYLISSSPALVSNCVSCVSFSYPVRSIWASPMAQVVKNPPSNAEDAALTPGLGSSPRGGRGNPLQYSCLENRVDGGAWWATVHGSQRVRHGWVTERSALHPRSVWHLKYRPGDWSRWKAVELQQELRAGALESGGDNEIGRESWGSVREPQKRHQLHMLF